MKALHSSGISTNTIDNNEVSTNVTVQSTTKNKVSTLYKIKYNYNHSIKDHLFIL